MSEKDQTPIKGLINTSQLAEFFGVPVSTVYFWTSNKKIPYLKIGKSLRFDPQKVIEHFNNLNQLEKPSCELRTLRSKKGTTRSLKTRGVC